MLGGGGESKGRAEVRQGEQRAEAESQWCAATVFSFLDISQVFKLASKSARTKITFNF